MRLSPTSPLLRWPIAAVLAVSAALPAAAAAPAPQYTGNIIVRWRDTPAATVNATDPVRRIAEDSGIGLAVKRQMAGNAQLLSVTKGGDPEAVAARLRADPRVADAVPDRWLRPFDTVPNDPEFASNQRYLQAPAVVAGGVNLPRAWDRTRGNPGLVVAVVDTGVLPHPDLAPRLVPGYDFISDANVAMDDDGRDADPTDPGDFVPQGYACPGFPAQTELKESSWHGTRVASVLGATTNNGQNIAGVDWNARIQPIRVSGRCGALLSDTVDAMRWAGGLPVPGVPDNPTPARVVNVSLGGGTCSSIEQDAVNALAQRGVVVVAAAGNDAGPVQAPADCGGVVAVTAHVNDGENASYASVGPQISLSAPGGGCGNGKVLSNGTCGGPVSAIRTLSNDGTTTVGNYNVIDSQGTSFAAPMVSGVAALMLAANGNLTTAQVLGGLKSSARPHPANTWCVSNPGNCGAGLLDAEGALAIAANPPTETVAPPPAPSGDGGGGAIGTLAGLGLALLGLALPRRRRRLS